MSETTYQNIDISQNNPLGFQEENLQKPSKNPKKPIDPKIILLIVLTAIVFLLFIVSLIVSSSRKAKTPAIPQNTPTPIEKGIPTISKSLIPQIYQDKFTQIENNLGKDLDIEVPSFDLEIGL